MLITKYDKYKTELTATVQSIQQQVQNIETSQNTSNSRNRTIWGASDNGSNNIEQSMYAYGNVYAYVSPEADDDEEDSWDATKGDYTPDRRVPPFEREEEEYQGCMIADDGFIGKRAVLSDNIKVPQVNSTIINTTNLTATANVNTVNVNASANVNGVNVNATNINFNYPDVDSTKQNLRPLLKKVEDDIQEIQEYQTLQDTMINTNINEIIGLKTDVGNHETRITNIEKYGSDGSGKTIIDENVVWEGVTTNTNDKSYIVMEGNNGRMKFSNENIPSYQIFQILNATGKVSELKQGDVGFVAGNYDYTNKISFIISIEPGQRIRYHRLIFSYPSGEVIDALFAINNADDYIHWNGTNDFTVFNSSSNTITYTIEIWYTVKQTTGETNRTSTASYFYTQTTYSKQTSQLCNNGIALKWGEDWLFASPEKTIIQYGSMNGNIVADISENGIQLKAGGTVLKITTTGITTNKPITVNENMAASLDEENNFSIPE